MPEFRRPSLLAANSSEVATHLLSKAVQSSITKDETAMLITVAGTSAQLDTALADYVPGAILGAEAAADAEAAAVFADFTPAQMTKLRAVYADPAASAFTKQQADKLLAAIALLVHRRLR